MLRISLGHEAPPVDAASFFCVDDVSSTSYSPILSLSLPPATLQALSVATRGAFRLGGSIALWRWDDIAVWHALGLVPPTSGPASLQLSADRCALPRARTVAGSLLPRVLVATTDACEEDESAAFSPAAISPSTAGLAGEGGVSSDFTSYPAFLSRANTHYNVPKGSYCLCLLPTHRLGALPTVTAATAQLSGRAGWLTKALPSLGASAIPAAPGSEEGSHSPRAPTSWPSSPTFRFPVPAFPALASAPPSLLLPRLAALLSRAPLCAHSLLKARAAALGALPGGGGGAGGSGGGAGAGGRGGASADAVHTAIAAGGGAGGARGAAALEEEAPAGKSGAGGAVIVAIFAGPTAPAPEPTSSSSSSAPTLTSAASAAASWGPAEPSRRLQQAGLLRHWGVLSLPLPLPTPTPMPTPTPTPAPAPALSPSAGSAALVSVSAEADVAACVQQWHATLAAADAATNAASGDTSCGAAACTRLSPAAAAWARARVCLHSADPAGGPALATLLLGHLFPPSEAPPSEAHPSETSPSEASAAVGASGAPWARSGAGTGEGSAVAGVLLSGPSGTGKRWLVHALAAAAQAPVVTITYAALRARALTLTPALSGAPPSPNTAAATPAAAALAAAAASAPAPGAIGLDMGAAAHALLSAALARAAPRAVVLFDAAHEALPAATVAGADVAAATAALARCVSEFSASAGLRGARAVLVATTDAVGRVNGPARRSLFPAVVSLSLPGQRQRARALALALANTATASQLPMDEGLCRDVSALLRPAHASLSPGPEASAGEQGAQGEQDAVSRAASESLRGASLGDIVAVAEDACALARARAVATTRGQLVCVSRADVAAAAAHASALFLSRSPLSEPPDPARLRGFAPIVGLTEAKSALRQTLQWPLRHPRVFARLGLSAAPADPAAAAAAADADGAGAGASGGVLLYGPPGTGKTMLARACAAEFGLAMFSLSAAALLRAGVGDSERLLRRLFKAASATAPSVIVFDDIHSMFPAAAGDGDDEEGGNSLLSELLQLLDARVTAAAGAVFFVATAPAPAAVNASLLRAGRLERRVFLHLPGDRDRAAAALGLARDMGLLPHVPTPAEAAAAEAAEADEWGSAALAEIALASSGLSYAALTEAFSRAQQTAQERSFLLAHAPEAASLGEGVGGKEGVRVKDVIKALRKMRRTGFHRPKD